MGQLREAILRITSLLSNAEYAGKAEGDRRTYHVFKSDAAYLLVASNSRGGFTLNPVSAEVPDVIAKRFKGRQVTANRLRDFSKRFAGFAALNALYVMVGLGRAKKLARKEGRSIVFRIQ
jgi:hypothetical protein